MSEEEIRKVFSENLKRYLEANNKQPVDIVNDLGIPFSTVSNWINGLKLPRMGKVEMLADYFGIEKSDLLEKKREPESYYLNPETAEIAQDIFENKELRMLFSVQRDMDPEDLKALHNMALALKRKEGYDGDDPA